MSSKKIKKDIQQKLVDTLAATLDGLNGQLSPKKRKRNIKKASKALVAGLKIVPAKKSVAKNKGPEKNGKEKRDCQSNSRINNVNALTKKK